MSEDIRNKVDETLANMRAPFPYDTDQAWSRLSTRIDAKTSQRSSSSRLLWFAAAASIALLIGFSVFNSNTVTTVDTALAEQTTVSLPDGSIVRLNADSHLSYDADEFLEDRSLQLDGEAFFEVQKGASFKVITDQGTISVLGTSFNVYERQSLFEVTCVTGKVAVEDEMNRVVLGPGLACDKRGGQLSEAHESAGRSAWTEGLFNFSGDPMNFVLNEISRQFNVSITASDLSEMRFSGEFDSSDLETALTVVCEPMGLNYLLEGDNVIITLK